MQTGRCHQGLGPALVSSISKRAYPVFMACSEILNHAIYKTISDHIAQKGRLSRLPFSVVENVSESASSAQNITVTTMAVSEFSQ